MRHISRGLLMGRGGGVSRAQRRRWAAERAARGGAPPERVEYGIEGMGGGRPEDGGREIRVGDYVQWTSGGVDQFAEPRPVAEIFPYLRDGENYVRVEGSRTGIPVKELTLVGRWPDIKGGRPENMENMEEEAEPDIEGVAAVFRRINPDPGFVVVGSSEYQLWREGLKPGDPALGEGIVGPLDRLYKDGYDLGHEHGHAKGLSERGVGYQTGYEAGARDEAAKKEAAYPKAVQREKYGRPAVTRLNLPQAGNYPQPGEIRVIPTLTLAERARLLGILHESKDHEVRTWALRLLEEGSGDGPKMVEPGFRRPPRQPRHPGET